MRNKAGFTLIEIMVSLVLVGLIAAISGTAVITATKSYLFARENDAITQKAQLALGRLNREFIELSDIKDANSTCVVYESPYGRRAVAKVGSAVHFFSPYAATTCPSSGGDILIDGVQTLSIMYNPSSGVSLWSSGVNKVQDLFAVNFQIILSRPDTGGAVSFYTTVSPRNNNNSGGAALPTASNPPPEYSGRQCFVMTAVYGDADHPVVVLLRQFRDRVLLPTDPGKALVRFYYEVGPSLAAAIEDRPLACLLVRLLVTPVAGFALLTLSCPVLIPLIFLLSWGFARLTFRALRRRSSRRTTQLRGQRGAILVTLIAAMVVFAALGAVMIGMFGTSALSQVAGNNSLKAYYLAESGFRYAASRFIAVNLGSETANDTERDRMMAEDLHRKEFVLGSNDGHFRLDIYPYYYKVTVTPSGSTNELITKVPGLLKLSSSDYNSKSWIQVKKKSDGSVTYEQISGASTHPMTDPNEAHFYRMCGYPPAVCNWDATVTQDSIITPIAIPDPANLSIADFDGDGHPDMKFLNESGAKAFPPRNGIIMVKVQGSGDARILAYRELDISNKLLKGVSDPNGVSVVGITLQTPGTAGETGYPKNAIALTKFVTVESTGTFGTGSSAVSRKVTYYTPIGYARALPEPKKQFHDTMDDLTKWLSGDDISKIGSFTAGTSYGKTMRVDETQAVNTIPGGSCLKYREFQVGLNLSVAKLPSGQTLYDAVGQEWLRAGNYLSYDLQMKAFYTWIYPSPRHGLGLTFRLDEQGNALGFTYARGIPGYIAGCDNDGIPHGWLGTIPGYTNYTPVLLFWMKQYAKKESGFDIVQSPCSATPPTTIGELPLCGRAIKAILTNKEWSFWENGERVRFTNTGGSLPPGITAGKDYFIRKILHESRTYLYLFSNETGALYFDPLWPGLQNITDFGLGTSTIIVQDPSFTKLAHQVLTSENEYYKLMTSYYLKGFSTFMTRLIEAPSVSFINGGGAAGREILSGETVYQTSDNLSGGTVNAVYRVMRSPVYRTASSGDRNWAANAAQGVLLLERIKDNIYSNPATHPFTSGSKIFVGDHPGGTWAATAGPSETFRARDNWILFYVGDTTGTPPADADPFNNYRGPVLRNSVLWPPDNTEDTVVNNDNFTLLRFSDYVNATYCTSFFTKPNNTAGSAGDVIRFTSPDGSLFYSPQSGTLPSDFPTSRAEFGLHAYGNDAAYSTEFDDFALQFGPGYGITRQGFLLPMQQ